MLEDVWMGPMVAAMLLIAGGASAAFSAEHGAENADAVAALAQLDAPWEAQAMPLKLEVPWPPITGEQSVATSAPVLQGEEGIGPGSRIVIQWPNSTLTGLCTANFIWSNPEGDRYLGTAGHCLIPANRTATHGWDADYDASGVRVQVALQECPARFLLSDVCEFVPVPELPENECCAQAVLVDLGEVVYARGYIEGHDFGLVAIPEDLHEEIRLEMPRWGGPDGVAVLEEGDPVVMYGHGIVNGPLAETRARVGIGLGADRWSASPSWMAAGMTYFGDSGSPLVLGVPTVDPQLLQGGGAIGIVTHAVGPVPVNSFLGTTIATAQEDVVCQVGIPIRMDPNGDYLEVCPPHVDQGCPEPDPGATPTDTLRLRAFPLTCLSQEADAHEKTYQLASRGNPVGDTRRGWTHTFQESAMVTKAEAVLWIRLTEDTLMRDLGPETAMQAGLWRNGEQLGTSYWTVSELGLPYFLPAGDHEIVFPPIELDEPFETGDELRLTLQAWSSSNTVTPTMHLIYGNEQFDSRLVLEGAADPVF